MVVWKVHCGSCLCTLSASSVIFYQLVNSNHPFDFCKKCFKSHYSGYFTTNSCFCSEAHIFVVDACAPTNGIQQLVHVQSAPSSSPQKSTEVKSLLSSKGPPQIISWLLSTVQNWTLTVLGWLKKDRKKDRKKERRLIILIFDHFRLTTLHFLISMHY